jgi:surface protein
MKMSGSKFMIATTCLFASFFYTAHGEVFTSADGEFSESNIFHWCPGDDFCEGNHRTSVKKLGQALCLEYCVLFPLIWLATGYSCGKCPECVADRVDILDAVDAYLLDDSKGSAVAKTYGWPINNWCVGAVTDFTYLFDGSRNPLAADFNKDLGAWDVSNAVSIQYMFAGATAFNADIAAWDVSNVEDMTGMFEMASSFNRDISGWDLRSVGSTEYMFYGASAFNSNIGSWNVSSVEDMMLMFSLAETFNRDISNWEIGSVNDFSSMFSDATNFRQNLCKWSEDMDGLTSSDVDDMFMGTNCPIQDNPNVDMGDPKPLCFDCQTPGGRYL